MNFWKGGIIMKWIGHLLLFLSLSLFTFAALDLNPPSWRDHPRATFQFWDFSIDDLSPFPDYYAGPFNPLRADVRPSSGVWLAKESGRNGVFPLSGEIFVPIYNFAEPLDEKIIQVQITWLGKGGVPKVEARADSPNTIPGITVLEWTAGSLLKEESLADGWVHGTYEVILLPNPSQEIIHIFGPIYIDDLIIDTVCIPEPATWGLLGIGSFILFWMSKRSFGRI
jgi:hypothetical protein